MSILFENRAKSTLAGSITNVATTLNVAAGEGAEFPNPGGGDYYTLTLNDGTPGGLYEICKVTARSGDTMTVVRAQEGTTALAWAAGSRADNLITAGTMEAIQQQNSTNQAQAANYAGADTGSADALVVALTPIPGSFSALIGAPVRFVKSVAANTGAATINVNGLGPTPIVHADGTAMAAGELPASGFLELNFDGTNFILIEMTHGAATTADMEGAANTFKQATAQNLIYHPAAIKAWAIFHWSGAAVVITDSYNVASITRSGAGAYLVTLSGGLIFANGYALVNGGGANPAVAGFIASGVRFTGTDPAFTIRFGDSGGSGGEASDPSDAGFVVFGKVTN